MIRNVRMLVLWLIMLATAGVARAQGRPPGHVSFRSFTAEDGLTNLVVLALAEDRHGALWIGTDDGLYRLDGEHVVRVAAGAGLHSQHVYAIAEAPTGELCVEVEQDFACGEDGGFHSERLSENVRALATTADALWLATERGLRVRRGRGPPELVETGLGDAATLLWADRRGVIVGHGAKLAEADASGGSWVVRTLDLGPGADEPRELLREPSGALWLRSDRHVWRVAPGESRAQDVTLGLALSPEAWAGRMMALSPAGELVLATPLGVATFRGARWDVLGSARGLPTPGAWLVYYDRAGDLWVGSVGIHRQLGRGVIERYTHATDQLPGDAAWSILRTAAGELLVGTSQCLSHVVDDRWACVAGTEGHAIRGLVEMSDGEIFFGGAPAVLLRRARDGTVSAVAELRSPRMVPRILALARASDDTLWIGSDAGLWRRPAGATSATEQVSPPGGNPARFISAIVADGPRVWFAGHEGLRMLEGATWHRFTVADGLRATEVRYVARRSDGRICVLYDQGFGVTCFRYRDGGLGELHHVGTLQGLDAMMAYSLGEDRAGRLWLGSGAGLRVISDDPAVAVDRFTSRDGISGDDATAMAFHLDRDGGVWLGSTGGLTHVAAERYRGPPAPPSVRMLTFTTGAGHDVHAQFIATDHVEADVDYEIRLPPYDSEWRSVAGHDVQLTALPPGDYQLELRARARDGAWGPVSHTPFVIPAAWWQTRRAQVAGGALVLALAWLLVLGWQRASLRRRTRSLRAQSDASFRVFVASLPDAVLVRRADGEIYLNQAARDLVGDRAGHDGAWLLRSVHPTDRRRAVELMRRRTPSPRGELVELRVGRGARWRDLEVALHTIELAGVLAHVVVGRDVTERRRLHERMVIADRMVSLGTLAAGMGHEINNPLTYVRSNLEWISELAASDQLAASRSELARAAREALDGSDRVRTIVRGLSNFHPSAHEQRVPIALADVIARAAQLTHNELRHCAQLVISGESAPCVLGDPRQLTQVVVNLLINAAHACPPGAADRYEIVVRTGRDGDGNATLEVEDHGVGMAPDVVARVFDPFFTTKRIGDGTGLGLSICHGIVTGLGGQISVESQRGRGTTVRITLPATTATVAERPSAPVASNACDPPARPRVLVVDDEAAVGDGIGRMLRRSFEVTVLTDSEEAVRRVATGERYDVIVSDVMMPVMTGLELYDQLRAIDPALVRRMMFVTGGAFSPATAERLEQLDVPRLLKPFTGDELRAMVRSVTSA